MAMEEDRATFHRELSNLQQQLGVPGRKAMFNMFLSTGE